MSYPDAALERAMKVQEVILKALTGELHWYRAADILGFSPRTLRRWRERYEQFGYDGLLDLRRRTPSRRREPKACFGELLHIDGSPHAWLALRPEERASLIAVLDDATKRVLYAQLWPSETAQAIMTALRDVVAAYGLSMALYTDRAHWAFHTPQAKGPVDKTQLTQVGRALERLGIEHIPAYSPQARGRSERLNRTFQDRLVNELRVAGITTLVAANGYLRERFVPQYNADFSCAPADPASAFVSIGREDLDQIFCHQEERVVGRDNTVSCDGHAFQLARQPGRRSCEGLRVTVRRHLTGDYSIWRGGRRLGQFPAGLQRPRDRRTAVAPMEAGGAVDAKSAPTAPWKTPKPRFPQPPQASV